MRFEKWRFFSPILITTVLIINGVDNNGDDINDVDNDGVDNDGVDKMVMAIVLNTTYGLKKNTGGKKGGSPRCFFETPSS